MGSLLASSPGFSVPSTHSSQKIYTSMPSTQGSFPLILQFMNLFTVQDPSLGQRMKWHHSIAMNLLIPLLFQRILNTANKILAILCHAMYLNSLISWNTILDIEKTNYLDMILEYIYVCNMLCSYFPHYPLLCSHKPFLLPNKSTPNLHILFLLWWPNAFD